MANFIIEQAIFQEAEVIKSSPNKAFFRMILQTVDEKNQNKRIYPSSVVMEALKECRPRMERRSFYGELDHPFPMGNDEYDGVRQTTVALKEASHIVREYELDGNKVIGELETLRTDNGRTLLGLLHDKTGVGISMRGMAELEKRADASIVKSPLTIICYDAVSLPSHSSAIVNFSEMRFESSILRETKDLVCIYGVCFLPNYFDKLVEKKIIKFCKKWI